nr:hypothetical protein [Tanacetum cinerariifolium]
DLDKEIISSEFNPIHNEDLDSTPKNDPSDTDSYLLESSLNRNTLISSLKIDSLLVEFVGALIFLESIPPGVDETNCDPEEDIHLVERLSYDNSSPRPPKEFVFENSDAEIESFSPSPIPNEDSDSFMEEIDLFLTPDDPMPPSIEDDEDSEGDILFERLLHDDPIPLPDILDFSYKVRIFLPFFTYLVTSPVLLSSGSEDKIFDPGITIDSLLAEFAGALIFLESIPPGVDETNCDPEEDIHLVERLSYDNSSPRPPKEFVFENSDAEIESFSPSPIPNEDSDSFMEEIDLFLTPDDPMPPSIEDDEDSEGDILFERCFTMILFPFQTLLTSHTKS